MLPFIITILSGLSFFIGYLITKFIKDEKKLTIFYVGFSFVIIIGLILFYLLPEFHHSGAFDKISFITSTSTTYTEIWSSNLL